MPKRPPLKPPKATRRPSKAGPAPSPKQQAFVREYLVDLNGTQAAIRAGYARSGADVQAVRLLANDRIRGLVEKAQEKRAVKTEITQERVLTELQRLAFSDVDDYMLNDAGKLVPAEGRPQEVMKAVSSVKYRTRTVGRGEEAEVIRECEFRLWDKPGTLKLAGRHTGLFPNEVKMDLTEGTLSGLLAMAHDIRKKRAG